MPPRKKAAPKGRAQSNLSKGPSEQARPAFGGERSSENRIACLLVPDLPLAAARRADPELIAQPVAIAAGAGPRAEILAVSSEAAQRGARPFTTVAQARAACAELQVRLASPSLERAAREALLDVARSASPRFEPAPLAAGLYAAEAAVFLDASGTGSLFRSEAGLATALADRAGRLGLPAAVTLAASRPTALVAARKIARGVREGGEPSTLVLPAGDDAAFLAPLPIDLLDPDQEVAEALARFGIRRIGELARLPRRALLTRLGAGARRLLELARGAEHAPLPAVPADTRCEEAIDLEVPLDRLEPLGFVLRGMLARLAERLGCRGLVCGDLDLRLDLEGGERDARRVGVAAPTSDVRVLLRLVCLSLESRPPPAAVACVSLATEGRAVRADQLDLFRPAGPAPALLARTVAELEALCGPGRVGAPAVADSHRPGAWTIARFAPAQTQARLEDETPARTSARGARARQPDREGTSASAQVDARSEPEASGVQKTCAVRALRPPVPAEVRVVAGRPAFVRSAVANGSVADAAGPWRTTGAWWSEEERFAFDHFDVWTSDGTVCRLRLDRVERRWEIDAVYD